MCFSVFAAIVMTLIVVDLIITQKKGLFQYPLTAVQVAVLYRFDNNNTMHTPNTLNLTRNAVCRLFAGNLTKWDDPEILDHNPALAANPAYVDQNVTVSFF